MKRYFFMFIVWATIIYIFAFTSSTPAFFDYSYESTSIIKENLPNLRHLLNFDGGHYQNIARFGYIRKFQTAFFPLYPSLIKILGLIVKSHIISALTISLVCTYLSILVLVKLYKKPISSLSLIFSPLAFFFLTGYTESLFLTLSLLSWYFFKKKKYVFSGLFGLLSSLSRLYGILLFPSYLLGFFLELPKDTRSKIASYKPIAPLLLIPLGLVIYMVYLQITYQDPISFIHAQSLWNRGEIVSPFRTFYRYFKILTTVSPIIIQYWVALLELLSLLVGLLASYYFYHAKQFSYSLYLFLGSIIPSLTGTLQSLPRFLLVLFPVYFIKLPIKLRVPLLTLGFALQLILFTAFLTGKFIS